MATLKATFDRDCFITRSVALRIMGSHGWNMGRYSQDAKAKDEKSREEKTLRDSLLFVQKQLNNAKTAACNNGHESFLCCSPSLFTHTAPIHVASSSSLPSTTPTTSTTSRFPADAGLVKDPGTVWQTRRLLDFLEVDMTGQLPTNKFLEWKSEHGRCLQIEHREDNPEAKTCQKAQEVAFHFKKQLTPAATTTTTASTTARTARTTATSNVSTSGNNINFISAAMARQKMSVSDLAFTPNSGTRISTRGRYGGRGRGL